MEDAVRMEFNQYTYNFLAYVKICLLHIYVQDGICNI